MVSDIKELLAYRAAFGLQQRLFEVSKPFPKEERYALTDQMRRSSRSVGANLSEAWRRHAYPDHFVSKLADADAELSETRHWLRTAEACGYLSRDDASQLVHQADEVGRLLGAMLQSPRRWTLPRRVKDASSPRPQAP